MTAPDFDHAKVRHAGDHVMPYPFELDRDTGRPPDGTTRVDRVPHGARVVDARGERFRVMGWGVMQGTVTMRDRHRAMFYAEGDTIVRPVAG